MASHPRYKTTLNKTLFWDLLRSRSPLLIQEVGHHAHEGVRLDRPALLQLIQVQSELEALGTVGGRGK